MLGKFEDINMTMAEIKNDVKSFNNRVGDIDQKKVMMKQYGDDGKYR